MRKVWLYVLPLCLMCSCKPSKPKGVLSEDMMTRVLVDYHLAQGMAETMPGDEQENRYLYIRTVFRKYGITEAQFDSSMVYYSEHAEDLSKIYMTVTERVQANAALMGIQTEQKSTYANLTSDGDTANIWNEQPMVALRPDKMDNMFSFSMKAESTYRLGDTFLWHFKTQYILQGNNREAFAQLLIQYDNDSILTQTQALRMDNEEEVRCTYNSKFDSIPIRSISGFLYMPIATQDPNVFRLLVVNDIALVRFHKIEKPVVEQPSDSLQNDSTDADTVAQPATPASHQRLNPMQMRESQPREKTIHVVKEQAVNPRLLRSGRSLNLNGRNRRK